MRKWVRRLTLGSNSTEVIRKKGLQHGKHGAPQIARKEGTGEDRCCRSEEVCGRVFQSLAEETEELKCAVQQLAQK